MERWDAPSSRDLSDVGEVARAIRERGARRVGIDGCSGAGKTTLAQQLAELLDGKRLDFDDYVNKGNGFIKGLRLGELKKFINGDSTDFLFLSGICMLAVLKRIEIKADLLIYVERRSSRTRIPGDLRILDCQVDGVAHLDGYDDLYKEVGRYHAQFKPRCKADIIFPRYE